MANWGNMVITQQGKALESKMHAQNKPVKFSKYKFGNGVISEDQTYEMLTDLVSPKLTLGVARTEAKDSGGVLVGTVLTNESLEVGFKMYEAGLFALDPDTGKDILYLIITDNDPDYLPPKNSDVVISVDFSILILVDSNLQITAKLDSTSLLTLRDLINHDNNSGAHREAFNSHDANEDAHSEAFQQHNNDNGAHTVIFNNFVKNVERKADDSFTVTKGNNSTTTVTINNVKHASNADEATKANYLVTNENGCIYHDLSKVSAGADINLHVNWSAKDTTRKILRYIFHDAKGTGSLADLQAKTVYANLSGNADTSNRLVSERASSGRITSANLPTSADASIRYFLSTDSMQYNKPMTDGAIVQFGWDKSNNCDSQLFIPNQSYGRLQWRPQNGSSTWATSAQWKSLAWQDDLNNYLPLTGGTITGEMTFNSNVNAKNGIIIPTRSRGDNTTYAASTAFVQDAINALINGSPGALDTLKELADALGNDANFAATITKALGLKAPLNSPTFTGTVTGPTPALEANNTQFATTAWVLQSIAANATGPIVGDVSNANGWWVKIPCQGFNLLIQGGRDMTSSDVTREATVSFPVAFKQCFNVEIALLGKFNESVVLSDFNNLYFERFSHQNFITDAHVVRPCTWIAYGISQ